MSRIKYRLGIREIVASFMVCVVMAASFGFSYNLHFCHGSIAETTFYPGFVHPVATCGCESTLKAGNTYAGIPSTPNFHRTECCKNISFFGKITPNSFNDFQQGVKLFSAFVLFENNPEFKSYFPLPALAGSIILSHHPPPLSGKLLVFYLNQLLIPSIPGIC
jgi:hypothetical protein